MHFLFTLILLLDHENLSKPFKKNLSKIHSRVNLDVTHIVFLVSVLHFMVFASFYCASCSFSVFILPFVHLVFPTTNSTTLTLFGSQIHECFVLIIFSV